MSSNTDIISYTITGIDRSGKRFSITTHNRVYAEGINVWRGNKWYNLRNGKRKLAQQIYN